MPSPFDVPMLIGGQWRHGGHASDRHDPYRGDLVARVPSSTAADVDDALKAACEARDSAAALPARERAALLRRVAGLLREQVHPIAQVMSRETGKALADAIAEVARAPDTLEIAAEEAVRIKGEHVPMDASPTGAGKLAIQLRFPVGVIVAITPFNAPINLACHKLAPAIAAGNTVVLKPSPQSSWVTHRLIELFVQAGTPPGVLNVVHGHEAGALLVKDPRTDFISFTGSSRVGAAIKAASGLRRVALELGGNCATIIDEDADIATAAATCARNAMRLAGQSCVSVQNVYVHQAVAETFSNLALNEVASLRLGDPLDPQTEIGTLVDQNSALRIESLIQDALGAGAELLAGGQRNGAQLQPTVLTRLNPTMSVVESEIFGPVLNILPVSSFAEAIRCVNASRYGLQAGVYTRSLANAMQAARSIRAGGIIINGSSTWRSDQMPYGGVKDSGIGREGPEYAMREMTEERLIVFNL